jgi:hypothetical protein
VSLREPEGWVLRQEKLMEVINREGAEGWELCCVDQDLWAYFKRQLMGAYVGMG